MEPQLNERSQAVLDAVVEGYIVSGEPVSSATVAEALHERVSSATVRNVMAELERSGYLHQPHTSAGRMPTGQGYRSYVGRLLAEDRIVALDEGHLRRRLQEERFEFTEFLQRICGLLVELTDQVGLVLAPALADAVLQHIDFVRLHARRVLVVFVAQRGWVHNQIVAVEEDVGQEVLDRAAGYLMERFRGYTLRDVRERVAQLHRELDERTDATARLALGLGARSLTADLFRADVLVEGTSRLLGRPELADEGDLRALFEAFERRSGLADLLADCISSPGPRVLVGTDHLPDALGHCTVIAAGYGGGARPLGTLGIIGPRRMQYARAIGAVDALARTASRMMAEMASSQ